MTSEHPPRRSHRSSRAARRIARGVAIVASVAVLVAVPLPAQADTVRDRQYWLTDYGFTTAWQTTQGDGVTVAVIDTGIDSSVTELQGAVVGGTDVSGIGSPNGQSPVGDDANHGTWVASLLAGRGTGEGNGVIGVAPQADLLSVSVAFGQTEEGSISTDDQIAAGVRWAVDNGADVINMSLTRNTRDWPESWDDAFGYAFANDVVVVAAAGNRGSGTTEVGAPATIPGVLTVAGVDIDREVSFDASSQGISIGVSAPSEQLVGVQPGNTGYVLWDGTSGAAPLVSGLVALVRSAYPELDANNVIQRVIATADPDGHEVPSPLYGWGLIDPPAALTAEVEPVSTNPMGDLSQWVTIHRRADLPTSGEEVDDETQEIVPFADPPDPQSRVALTLWPTPSTLAYITLPLALLLGFGTLATLLGIGATRHIRRTSRHET